MFAVHPALMGRKGKVVLGKKSGKLSVNYKLDELGLGTLEDEQGAAVLSTVKELGNRKRGLVTDDEFREIVQGIHHGK